MVVAELDEVDYELEVDGELVRRTLHRRVVERGAWATVAIVYEERGEDGWKPPKLAVIRLQKVRDAWKKHAIVTLGVEDARAVGELIGAMSGAGAETGTGTGR